MTTQPALFTSAAPPSPAVPSRVGMPAVPSRIYPRTPDSRAFAHSALATQLRAQCRRALDALDAGLRREFARRWVHIQCPRDITYFAALLRGWLNVAHLGHLMQSEPAAPATGQKPEPGAPATGHTSEPEAEARDGIGADG